NEDDLVEKIDRCCVAIGEKLEDWSNANSKALPRLLFDSEKRSPYKPVGQSKGPLDRINIRTTSGQLVDLAERSNVVAALKDFKLFRVYADAGDTESMDMVRNITSDEVKNGKA